MSKASASGLDPEAVHATLWRVQVGEIDDLPDEFLERSATDRFRNLD